MFSVPDAPSFKLMLLTWIIGCQSLIQTLRIFTDRPQRKKKVPFQLWHFLVVHLRAVILRLSRTALGETNPTPETSERPSLMRSKETRQHHVPIAVQ